MISGVGGSPEGKLLIRTPVGVVDWDLLRRSNASGVAGILVWALGGWAQGKALAGIVFKSGGLSEGKPLTGIPARVVDWDLLGRSNAFEVAGILVWVSRGCTQGKILAGVVFGTGKLLGGKPFTKTPAKVVDGDSLGRSNAFGIAAILVWVPGAWVQGKALAGVVSGARGLFQGKLLTGRLAGVVDWGTLGREMAFGVGVILDWASGGWSQGRALAGIVASPIGQDKLLGKF